MEEIEHDVKGGEGKRESKGTGKRGGVCKKGPGKERGKSGEHADEARDNEMNEAYLGSACRGIIEAL